MVDGYGDGLVIECSSGELGPGRGSWRCGAAVSGGVAALRRRKGDCIAWQMACCFAETGQSCGPAATQLGRLIPQPPSTYNPHPLTEDLDFLRTTAFGLLQGCRMRNTKTEYVSCPSCGRTLFDLQDVTDQIRVATGHLPGTCVVLLGGRGSDVGQAARLLCNRALAAEPWRWAVAGSAERWAQARLQPCD